MSKYLGKCWRCDSCDNIDNHKPWECPLCNRETCEWCVGYHGVCDSCCGDKSLEEIKKLIKYVDEDEECN